MKPTLLIANPIPLHRKQLSDLLIEHFQLLGEAKDGREAIEMTLRLKPQVALFEAVMPKLSASQAITFLREQGASTQFVVVTALSTDTAVSDALNAGAAEFLIRPIDRTKLLWVLQRCAKAATQSEVREARL